MRGIEWCIAVAKGRDANPRAEGLVYGEESVAGGGTLVGALEEREVLEHVPAFSLK